MYHSVAEKLRLPLDKSEKQDNRKLKVKSQKAKAAGTPKASRELIGGELWSALRFGEDAGGGGGYAVACGVFDEVHGFVGEMEEAGLVGGIEGIGGDADAGGDADVQTCVLQPGCLFDQPMQAARNAAGIFLGSLRKKKNKFISAISESEVDEAAVALDHGADFAEEL